MAALGKARSKQYKPRSNGGRVSPLKPGLRGMRNWTTAQIRSASYSKTKRKRLVWSALVLTFAIICGGLWLGGFGPDIKASGDRAVKKRLVGMGFVVRYVDVVGDGRISEAQVRAALGVRAGDFLFDMDIDTAQSRVQSLSWVDTAVVRRLWPDRVVVHINERRAYALWQVDQSLHVIDKEGVVISDARAQDFGQLPLIVGKGANIQAANFLNMMNNKSDLDIDMRAGVYVGNRRWDIVQSDGRRIMLPAKHPDLALVRLRAYQQKSAVLDLDYERVDLRINDRIYVTPRLQHSPPSGQKRA